jgi:acyl-CoA reductase-like NAD-dependent aldehyde dehydrogenase
MANPLSKAFDRLLSSVTDGRAENTRFRQNQLHSLHARLKAQKTEICSALSSSSSSTSADAEAEYFLTLDAINQIYETLDFEKALKEEYLITTGANNVRRKVAVGLVTVKPSSHSRFYSAVVPSAAAVAAGNCILLEVSTLISKMIAVKY